MGAKPSSGGGGPSRTRVVRSRSSAGMVRSVAAAAPAGTLARATADVRGHGHVPRRAVEPARLPAPVLVLVLVPDAREELGRRPRGVHVRTRLLARRQHGDLRDLE